MKNLKLIHSAARLRRSQYHPTAGPDLQAGDVGGLICRLGFFIFLAIFIPASLQAGGLRIDPVKNRLVIPQGGTKSGTIKIEASSDTSVKVKVYLEDWKYNPVQDGSKDFAPAGTLPSSAANWISFAPAEFTVEPYGRQLLGYTVNVPSNATGGHYTVLFFETAIGEAPPGTIQEGVAVKVFGRIGVLFYIEPQDTINKEVRLYELEVKRKDNSLPLEVALSLQNIGNVDITAGGKFHLMDNAGLIYARGEFNDVYTFPTDTAKFTAKWNESIPKGKYDLVLTLDIGKAQEEAGLGRGPVIIKEAEVEIGENGGVLKAGELK